MGDHENGQFFSPYSIQNCEGSAKGGMTVGVTRTSYSFTKWALADDGTT